MKENEEIWKIKRKNERKWKKMKEKWKMKKKKNEKKRKMKKMNIFQKWKNEVNGKWKKWKNEKKTKKWKKKKKNEKIEKNWWKEKEKWKKLDSHAKSSTISRVYRCCCIFFVKIFDDFHDFVSECVSFPRKINNPFWVGSVFPEKSDNFHWTWNKNTHVTDENQRKKSLRSARLSIIFLLE